MHEAYLQDQDAKPDGLASIGAQSMKSCFWREICVDEEKSKFGLKFRLELLCRAYSQNQNFEEKSHILPKQPTTPIQRAIWLVSRLEQRTGRFNP